MLVNGRDVMPDVTAAVEAEELKKKQERYYQSLMQGSIEIVAIVDRYGIISYVSPSIERVLGYTADEFTGCSAFDQLHPSDRFMMEQFRQLRDSPQGTVISVSYRRRHKDGRWRCMETTATNLLEDPATAGIITNSRDVTEQQRTELHLRHVIESSPATLFVMTLGADTAPPGERAQFLGIWRVFQDGGAARREPVADVEGLGEPELLELGLPLLQREVGQVRGRLGDAGPLRELQLRAPVRAHGADQGLLRGAGRLRLGDPG